METVSGLITGLKINPIKNKRMFLYKIQSRMLVVGLVCMAFWLCGFINQHDRAMFSYLYSYISIIGLALGSMIFVLLQHVSRAGWSISVRRIPEAAMATIPLFILLFIPIALNVDLLFPWTNIDLTDKILINKYGYLNVYFFYVRSFIYLVVWMFIGLLFYKLSVNQDGGFSQLNSRNLWLFSAPAIIAFAFTISFSAFDWIMSLQPHWFSTIFGIYIFSGNFLSSLAFIVLFLMFIQKNNVMNIRVVNIEHYHDLGKLIFAFTIFWAYIAFSQFMLYWYGNIPEETEFYLHRLKNGWEWLSYLLPFTNFVVPFFLLLSRHAKRNNYVLLYGCLWTIFFHFVDVYWLILPNYASCNQLNNCFMISWMDFICPIGMLSLFISYICYLLSKVDIIPSGDPRLKESLMFENF